MNTQRCRKALRNALDVDPSPETRALGDAIRTFSRGTRAAIRYPAQPFPRNRRFRWRRLIAAAFDLESFPFLATRAKDDQNLALSLSQEVAAGLARFRWFDVIAPASLARKPSAHLAKICFGEGAGSRGDGSAVGEREAPSDQCSALRYAVRFPGWKRSIDWQWTTGISRTSGSPRASWDE